MRLKHLIPLSLIGMLAISSQAQAAWYDDSSYSFESGYVGLILGGVRTTDSVSVNVPNVNIPKFNASKTSPALGLAAGYGASWDRAYMGIEVSTQPWPATIQSTSANVGGTTYSESVTVNDMLNLDLLPGYYITDGTYGYLRGGVALMRVHADQANNGVGEFNSVSNTTMGARLGAGVDMAVTKQVSLGLDYIHTFSQSFSNTGTSPVDGLTKTQGVSLGSDLVALHIRYNMLS